MIEFKRKGGFDEKRNILCKLACFNNDILVYPRLNTLIFTTWCLVDCLITKIINTNNSFVKRIANVTKE